MYEACTVNKYRVVYEEKKRKGKRKKKIED